MADDGLAEVVYKVAPEVRGDELSELFAAAWGGGAGNATRLEHILSYLCAYREGRLVGFVNLAWDGGVHAFILDTTVHPEFQRQGIGVELVTRAAALARERGLVWLHVDFEPHLTSFYERCGFRPTAAGLMRLMD
ncbi:GNAT family N-acetyltransferase [soil metagenome]